MFVFFSNRMGCIGSLVVSLIGTAILILLLRSCNERQAPGLEREGQPQAAATAG